MYLTSPFLYVVFHRYRTQRKLISLSGFAIMLTSLIGASFASTVLQLLVTQGMFYAIGGAMLYFPVFNYLDEWFIERRGLAYGALMGGGGAGGVIIPFVMEWLLNRWGFRTALRIWVITCLLLGTPALALRKDYPVDQNAQCYPRKVDLRFLKSKAFWILQCGDMAQGLGYFIPIYYLPCKLLVKSTEGLALTHCYQPLLWPVVGLRSQVQSPFLYAMQRSWLVQWPWAGSAIVIMSLSL